MNAPSRNRSSELLASWVGPLVTIIAHRLATIRQVDRIYVIEDGTVIEQGTHTDLTAAPHGHYRRIAEMQFTHPD